MNRLMLTLSLVGVLGLAACQSIDNTVKRAGNAEFGCIAGTVGGAVIGGLVGSTIGAGTGNVMATAAGIGAGGYVGNRLGCK